MHFNHVLSKFSVISVLLRLEFFPRLHCQFTAINISGQCTQIRKRQICLTLGFIWSKIRGNSAATFIKQKYHKIDWILRFWGICLCKWRFTQNSLHKKTVWHSKFLEKMNLHKETPKDGKIQSILRLFCFTKLTAKFPV